MELIKLTLFRDERPIYVNTTHIVSVSRWNDRTQIQTVDGPILQVIETIEQILGIEEPEDLEILNRGRGE